MGSQLVVPVRKRQEFIKEFHDSLFAGHLGITRTVYRLLDRVYWPGIHGDVQTYIKSSTICIARKSPCPRKVPMGHVNVGHRWERVAMDLYWTCRSPQHGVIDIFSLWWTASPGGQRRFLYRTKQRNRWRMRSFNQIVCRFGMPSVIHSDQGREFENKIMQELCLLGGSHKTRTTPFSTPSISVFFFFFKMLTVFIGKDLLVSNAFL